MSSYISISLYMYYYYPLKGTVSRDFLLPFFQDSNPSGSVFHMLKYFAFGFDFALMG